MIRHLHPLLFVALLAGCASGGGEPWPPMFLPDGFDATYTIHTERSDAAPSDTEEQEIACSIIRHENPASAVYCGYLIHVAGDAFSFDTVTRPAYSFAHGELDYKVTGAGDTNGAEIHNSYEAIDGHWWMTTDFTVTHWGAL